MEFDSKQNLTGFIESTRSRFLQLFPKHPFYDMATVYINSLQIALNQPDPNLEFLALSLKSFRIIYSCTYLTSYGFIYEADAILRNYFECSLISIDIGFHNQSKIWWKNKLKKFDFNTVIKRIQDSTIIPPEEKSIAQYFKDQWNEISNRASHEIVEFPSLNTINKDRLGIDLISQPDDANFERMMFIYTMALLNVYSVLNSVCKLEHVPAELITKHEKVKDFAIQNLAKFST